MSPRPVVGSEEGHVKNRIESSRTILYARIALFIEAIYPSYFLLKDITNNKEKVRLDSSIPS